MTVRWTEYDPYTGVTSINVAEEDGDEIRTHRVQDVEPLLRRTAETRNTRSGDNASKNLNIYCSVPVVVQYALLQKGINIFNPDHMPRVLSEINSNYPHLKYTDKTHSLTPRANSSSKQSSSPTQETSEKPGPFVIVR